MAHEFTLAVLPARSAEIPSGEGSRLERITVSGGDRYTVNFSSTANQTAIWTIPVLPALADYATGDRILRLNCISDATTGDVDFDATMEYVGDGDTNDLDSTTVFISSDSSDNNPVKATAGYVFTIDIDLSLWSGSVNPQDCFRIKLTRDANSDTCTGTIKVLGAELLCSATSLDLTNLDKFFHEGARVCEGRLTLENGVSLSVDSQFSKTTLYYTPHNGNQIALYDTTYGWWLKTFSQISIVNTTFTASKPHDIFVYDNSGTLTLDIVAWTNDTTRATALATQDNVYVKSGAANRRYIGTVYANGSKFFNDTTGYRLVWNLYNQRERPVKQISGGSSATYATATTYRAAGNNTNVRAYVVTGLAGYKISMIGGATLSCSGFQAGNVAIAEDTTTAPDNLSQTWRFHNQGTIYLYTGRCDISKYVPLGYHYYQTIEYQDLATTTTWEFGLLGGSWAC